MDTHPPRGNRFARVVAGTIELFVGAYCWTFGSLAGVYFALLQRPRRSMLCAAAALFGILLIFRAQRMLGWKRWFFLLIALPLLIVPIVYYLPPLFGYQVPFEPPVKMLKSLFR